MMRQKLSVHIYETAFVSPKYISLDKNQASFETILPLVLGQFDFGPYHLHQLERLPACYPKIQKKPLLFQNLEDFFVLLSLSCHASTGYINQPMSVSYYIYNDANATRAVFGRCS